MRIIELLNRGDRPTYSLEFFPPKTDKGHETIRNKIEQILDLPDDQRPIFIDLTWSTANSTDTSNSNPTLTLASQWTSASSSKNINPNKLLINMHITCITTSVAKIDETLNEARRSGITNLVILRGDMPKDKDPNFIPDFRCALDVVKHVKSKFSNDFCISVSGYPEGHPDQIQEVTEDQLPLLSESELGRLATTSKCIGNDGISNGGMTKSYTVCRDIQYEQELAYLKAKVDSGANMIITQLFYDPNVFLRFVHKCRQVGIPETCPIIPGIMLIHTHSGFINMTKQCKTRVPTEVVSKVEELKEKPDELIAYSITLTNQMVSYMWNHGVKHFHLYTMNRDIVSNSVVKHIQTLQKI